MSRFRRHVFDCVCVADGVDDDVAIGAGAGASDDEFAMMDDYVVGVADAAPF